MADLRVCCIGAGYFSAFHVEAWSRLDAARLVAVADLTPARAEMAIAGLTAGAPDLANSQANTQANTRPIAYADPSHMLTDQRPDIVDIITPPSTHLAMIRAALAVSPKAIICQKPFCGDLAQAQHATALAEAAGVTLVVHENFRFQPWYRAIRAALDAGQIGEIHQITFRLRPGDGQGPRAYLDRQPYFQDMPRFLVHETAVHWIDTFRFLMGPAHRVFADLRQMNPAIAGEDAGYLLFDHGAGRRALFDGNRLLDHRARNTRATMGEALVEGTQGTLTLLGDGSVHLRRFGQMTNQELLPPTPHQSFGGDCVYHLQAHVVRALTEGTAFENTAAAYLPVLETEAAIYRAAASGRWEPTGCS